MYILLTLISIISAININPNTGTDVLDCLSSINPCKTIQYAITYGENDIFLEDGQYHKGNEGNINVTRNLFITSINRVKILESTFIIENNKNVTFSGFQMFNCVVCIKTQSHTIIHISEMNFENSHIAILFRASDIYIHNTSFINNHMGMSFSQSNIISNIKISNSTFESSQIHGIMAKLVITDTIFTLSRESAIALYWSEIYIDRCMFINNVGSQGGAICIGLSKAPLPEGKFGLSKEAQLFEEKFGLSIKNSYFHNNSANNGGAIFLANSSGVIENNIIENNNATKGGGIYIKSCFLTIFDTTIMSNIVEDIFCEQSDLTLYKVYYKKASCDRCMCGIPTIKITKITQERSSNDSNDMYVIYILVTTVALVCCILVLFFLYLTYENNTKE